MDRRRKEESHIYTTAHKDRAERTGMNIWELCKEKNREDLEQIYLDRVRKGDSITANAISLWLKLYGNQVEVIDGVKVPLGTTGKVFFIKSQHRNYRNRTGWSYLIGIEQEDGTKVFTNANNVKVVKQ